MRTPHVYTGTSSRTRKRRRCEGRGNGMVEEAGFNTSSTVFCGARAVRALTSSATHCAVYHCIYVFGTCRRRAHRLAGYGPEVAAKELSRVRRTIGRPTPGDGTGTGRRTRLRPRWRALRGWQRAETARRDSGGVHEDAPTVLRKATCHLLLHYPSVPPAGGIQREWGWQTARLLIDGLRDRLID